MLVNTGEFSAIRWANGSSQWLQDAIDLFEKYGFSWAFFAYKENNIWDPRFKEFTYETWKNDYAQWLADCKSGGNTTEECWLAFIQQYRGERGYWDVCQPGKECSCKYGDNFSGLSLCWMNDYQGYDTKRWAVLKAAYAKNPTKCGNSICDPGETPQTCPADCACSPADSNCDGCINNTEMNAFIGRWKANSSDVTLKELIGAMGIWKSGAGC